MCRLHFHVSWEQIESYKIYLIEFCDFTLIQNNIVSLLNQSRCQKTYYVGNFRNVKYLCASGKDNIWYSYWILDSFFQFAVLSHQRKPQLCILMTAQLFLLKVIASSYLTFGEKVAWQLLSHPLPEHFFT